MDFITPGNPYPKQKLAGRKTIFPYVQSKVMLNLSGNKRRNSQAPSYRGSPRNTPEVIKIGDEGLIGYKSMSPATLHDSEYTRNERGLSQRAINVGRSQLYEA